MWAINSRLLFEPANGSEMYFVSPVSILRICWRMSLKHLPPNQASNREHELRSSRLMSLKMNLVKTSDLSRM